MRIGGGRGWTRGRRREGIGAVSFVAENCGKCVQSRGLSGHVSYVYTSLPTERHVSEENRYKLPFKNSRRKTTLRGVRKFHEIS